VASSVQCLGLALPAGAIAVGIIQSPEDSSRYSIRTRVSSSKCRRVDQASMHGERETQGKGETILNCQWLNVTKDRASVETECSGDRGLTDRR